VPGVRGGHRGTLGGAVSGSMEGQGGSVTRRTFLAASAAFVAVLAGGVRRVRASEPAARDARLPRIRTRPNVREDLYRAHDLVG